VVKLRAATDTKQGDKRFEALRAYVVEEIAEIEDVSSAHHQTILRWLRIKASSPTAGTRRRVLANNAAHSVSTSMSLVRD
jgi:hypothetical protein